MIKWLIPYMLMSPLATNDDTTGANGAGGGQQPTNGDQNGASNQPRMMTEEDVRNLLSQVREEEKGKLNGRLRKEKEERTRAQQERDNLKAEMEALRRENRENEVSRLKPDERLAAQVRQMQEDNERQRIQHQAELDARDARLRATELEAYRQRAIREYKGEIFPSAVHGQTEEEIDQAAEDAHKSWKQERQTLQQQLEADFAQRQAALNAQNQNQQTVPQQTQQPVPSAVVPYNPSYVQPQVITNPGLPTVVNPQSLTEQPLQLSIQEMTTEDAVRSGRYGGEMRARIMAQLKNQSGGSRTLGSTPRHMVASPVQVVEQPGGVIQPQGFPTGPVVDPRIQHVPPQGSQPGVSAQEAARNAVARTHAGGNPLVNSDPAARIALNQAQATGQQPQQAFAQRFTPTPPIDPNQQQN